MDVELLALLIEVVQSRPAWCEYVVRLEADHIMEEPAELINLALDLDIWS